VNEIFSKTVDGEVVFGFQISDPEIIFRIFLPVLTKSRNRILISRWGSGTKQKAGNTKNRNTRPALPIVIG